MIDFSIDNSLWLLFMTEQPIVSDLAGVLLLIEDNYDKILSSIINEYGVEKDTAERLYRHLWIYSHGIATLCVTGMCRFTGEEISTMMTEVFTGLLKNAKGERHND